MAVPLVKGDPDFNANPTSALSRVRASLPPSFKDSVRSGRQLIAADGVALPDPPLLPTTIDPVDRLLDGGLPRGRLVELTGKRSRGRFSTLLSALAATTSSGELAALIDLGDGFDPRVARDFGIDLERLLWIRPDETRTAMISAELSLQAGFSLVAVDLGLAPVPGGRGTEAGWMRLARAAADQQSALFVSSPYRVSSTAAATVLTAEEARCQWNGDNRAPRLLIGLDGRFSISKSRLASRSGSEPFRLTTTAGRLVTVTSSLPRANVADIEPRRQAAGQ